MLKTCGFFEDTHQNVLTLEHNDMARLYVAKLVKLMEKNFPFVFRYMHIYIPVYILCINHEILVIVYASFYYEKGDR